MLNMGLKCSPLALLATVGFMLREPLSSSVLEITHLQELPLSVITVSSQRVWEKRRRLGAGPPVPVVVGARFRGIYPDAPPGASAMAVAGLHCGGDGSGSYPHRASLGEKPEHLPSALTHGTQPIPIHLLLWASWMG